MAASVGDRPARFANRTVTLTLEVAACSNIYSTVYAKAWVDQITITTRSIWPLLSGSEVPRIMKALPAQASLGRRGAVGSESLCAGK
jgi:hypothetical protein